MKKQCSIKLQTHSNGENKTVRPTVIDNICYSQGRSRAQVITVSVTLVVSYFPWPHLFYVLFYGLCCYFILPQKDMRYTFLTTTAWITYRCMPTMLNMHRCADVP